MYTTMQGTEALSHLERLVEKMRPWWLRLMQASWLVSEGDGEEELGVVLVEAADAEVAKQGI